MNPPSTAPAQFAAAGRRHLDDGQLLLEHARHVTADHLAGLAAECILKAVLVDFLGATLSPRGIPQTPTTTGGLKNHRHLPGLWPEVAVQAGGRGGAQFIALLTAANPFAGWNIADRYADGNVITQQCANDHLAVAMNVAQIHEQAVLNGFVP